MNRTNINSSIVQAACGPNTEDRTVLLEDSKSCLMVVADGAGGHRNGAMAADLVAGFVEKSWRESSLNCCSSMGQMLREADGLAFHASNCGQTTAVVVLVMDGSVFGASVGDSEAWLITDQNYVNLTFSQRSRHLLGSGKADPVTFLKECPSGVLLIGSDGLFRRVPAWKACDICINNSPFYACNKLLEAAKLQNGKFSDDVSIIVCKF